jgi:hypothetical protein
MQRRVGSPAKPYLEINSHALSSRYPTHSRPQLEGRQRLQLGAKRKTPPSFLNAAAADVGTVAMIE